MNFTKTAPGTYTDETGRWTIVRGSSYEVHLDGFKIMGYRTLTTAKAGAHYQANTIDLAALDAKGIELITR